MSNSNGKITAPVSIDNDIAPVLGAPVNSNLGQLCTYSTINPYSKFKPVKSSIPFASNNPKQSYWYRSEVFSTEPCGLKLTIYDIDSGNLDRSDSLEGCFEKWKDKYQPPIGYPYRALDFDGYNHKAPYFIQVSMPYAQADGSLYVGTNESNEQLNVFFDCFLSLNPLSLDNISIIDIESCFLASSKPVPPDSMGILGLMVTSRYGPNTNAYLKSVSMKNGMLPYITLNVKPEDELEAYNYFTSDPNINKAVIPFLTNVEIPKWTMLSKLKGQGIKVIFLSNDMKNYYKLYKFKKGSSVVDKTDYVVRAYKYGSNFTIPFSPLENPVNYNGSSSICQIEMEIILVSSKVNPNSIPLIGYQLVTPFNYTVSKNSGQANPSGGSWTKVYYNGANRDCYRWSSYSITDMFRTSNGEYQPYTGMIPSFKWTNPSYNVEGTFYLYLQS